MGHTVVFNNSDWAYLHINMRKEQRLWRVVSKLLTHIGETVRAQARMYKDVLHMVLLYRSESWVVTEAVLEVLEGFHHQVVRRIARISAW